MANIIETSIKRLQDNDKTLIELNLNAVKITQEQISLLATALARNKFLQILDFSNNFIGSHGVKVLAKALEKNQVLHTLYLRSSEAGDEGTIALANALKRNDSLKNLYLGNNKIGPAGVEAMANVLSSNSTLEILSFRTNDVGNSICKVLANNLEINATLKTLNLANTNIGDEGAFSLLNILNINTNLIDIKLNYNEIESSEILEKVSKRLKYNSSQNIVAINAVARKILTHCEEYLTWEELGDKRTISDQDIAKKYGLAKEDLYYLSKKNSNGGVILCVASLFRMALNKYNQEAVDLILQSVHKIYDTLFLRLREEMVDEKIEKPNDRIISLASSALEKINAVNTTSS